MTKKSGQTPRPPRRQREELETGRKSGAFASRISGPVKGNIDLDEPPPRPSKLRIPPKPAGIDRAAAIELESDHLPRITILIALDTNPTRALPRFTRDIRRYSRHYNNVFGETYLVDTDRSIQFWYDHLSQHLTEGDGLFIIQIQDNYAGIAPDETWEWLRTFKEEEEEDF